MLLQSGNYAGVPDSLKADDQRVLASSTGKRFAAAVLSGVVPGVGQLLLGATPAGALFLAVFGVGIALFWPPRLPLSYAGFIVSVLALAALSVVSAWNAARLHDARSRPLSRWWLLLIVPLAYLGSSFDTNRALRLGGFQVFSIPSSSMENTLRIGDRIIVDRRQYDHYSPELGDVAVFRREGIWEVKRIMALPGDTISGQGGVIYRNGRQLREPYVIHTIGSAVDFPNMNDFGPVTVSKGEIFVLGDNRDVSYDSRQPKHGPIHLSAESGKPLYIAWSRDRRRIGATVR